MLDTFAIFLFALETNQTGVPADASNVFGHYDCARVNRSRPSLIWPRMCTFDHRSLPRLALDVHRGQRVVISRVVSSPLGAEEEQDTVVVRVMGPAEAAVIALATRKTAEKGAIRTR